MPIPTKWPTCFAMFHTPGSNHFTTLLQHTNPATYNRITDVPLTGGYVVVPFTTTAECPIVFIRAEELHEEKIPTMHDAASYLLSPLHTTDDDERAAYAQSFQEVKQRLADGRVEKVVLSRRLHYHTESTLQAHDLFLKACHARPDCFVSLWHTPQTGTWLVATPEPLLKKTAQGWSTVALAGTLPWKEGEQPLWNHKNREEQTIVARYIEELLHERCTDWDKSATYSRRAGNIQHLCTDFSFRLKQESDMLDLLQALHPTPAVCGLPCAEARQAILSSERTPRGYYAGFSGPLQLNDCTALYVSLRCMQFTAHDALLYAGGGIMRESTENEEWEETNRKLQTMRLLLP